MYLSIIKKEGRLDRGKEVGHLIKKWRAVIDGRREVVTNVGIVGQEVVTKKYRDYL